MSFDNRSIGNESMLFKRDTFRNLNGSLNGSNLQMKNAIQKKREKNEANAMLTRFKQSFTGTKKHISTLQEKIKLLPTRFNPEDWQEPLLYAYFAINYFDEQMFNVILNKASKFKNFEELNILFAQNERCYFNLTSGSSNLKRTRLN